MTAPVPLSEWEYPWLAGLLPLTDAENALGRGSGSRAARRRPPARVNQNNSTEPGDDRSLQPSQAGRPASVVAHHRRELDLASTIEQLAFDELIMRTSHLESLGNRPGCDPRCWTTDGFQLPQGTANEPNFITALDGKITLLRVNDSRGNPLDADGIAGPTGGAAGQQTRRVDQSVSAVGIHREIGQRRRRAATVRAAPPESPGSRWRRQKSPGVKIAVIDTGIAKQPRTDKWLDNIAGPGRLNTDPLYPNLDPVSTADDFVLGEVAGHGTFVSGVIRQVRAQRRVSRSTGSSATTSSPATSIWPPRC